MRSSGSAGSMPSNNTSTIHQENRRMTLAKIENLTVTVRKTVKAPVEKAFRAWTEPNQMTKWFGCDKVANVQVSQDFRVGGDYRITGESCDSGGAVAVYGTYEEIVQNKKVVYTWNNE